MVSSANGCIVVVTGLSGSGKSTALKAMEDLGYLAIDNLPVVLLPKFLAIRKESGGFIHLAVGMDAREPELAIKFEEVFKEAQAMGYELRLVFIEAAEEVLVKRFSETRRPHHMAPHGGIIEAIRSEISYLSPLRQAAEDVIDSTGIKASDLRKLMMSRFCRQGDEKEMAVEILSFGFKNGLPTEADLVMDVRFLPNPFYIDELRNLDGRDQPVSDYVLGNPESPAFLEKFMSLLLYLLPLYQKEGKSYLTIAVGCTGGQHRSVAVSCFLHSALAETFGGSVHLSHRDVAKARAKVVES